MAVLDELAVFVIDYCASDGSRDAADVRNAIAQILTSIEFPTDIDRHEALYGFALSCGAVRAAGFDVRWIPSGLA